tara:strand:+ start:815 stop:1297 length:483 start_codon:yes stop_codon:yes gene_type:complete
MASPVMVDSLTYSNGYHTFYLVYMCDNYYNVHPVSLGLRRDNGILTVAISQSDIFEKFTKNDDIIFGVYRHIVSKTSTKTADIESIERFLNTIDPIIDPNIMDIFMYDIKEFDMLGDNTTLIIPGEKSQSNLLTVKIKKIFNNAGESFRIFDPSFSLKLK